MQNAGQTGSFSWRHMDKAWLSEQIQLWRNSFNLKHGFRQKQFATWFFFERKYSSAQGFLRDYERTIGKWKFKVFKIGESFVSLSFIFCWSKGVRLFKLLKWCYISNKSSFFIGIFHSTKLSRMGRCFGTFILKNGTKEITMRDLKC